jgi:autotransporter-associated beta strand protein
MRNSDWSRCGLDALRSALPLFVAVFFAIEEPASAATRTWTGNAIGNVSWNNVTNWSGFAIPGNGDSLFFPSVAGNKSSVNNLGVTNYGTIYLAGSNYVFSGATIALSAGIVATNRGGTNTFATPLVLRADQTFSADGFPGNPVLQLASVLDLNGNNLTWNATDDIRAFGPIIGLGAMVKIGGAELLLAASNSFTGSFDVRSGELRLGHAFSLGSTNAALNATNATVILNTNVAITNKTIGLGEFGELLGEGGTNVWAGPIMATNFVDLTAATGAVLRLSGVISGVDGVNFRGPGTIALMGNDPNTESGADLLIDGVTLLLNKPPGVVATASRLIISDGSTVRLLASEQMSNTRSVTISDGDLDLNGFTDTIAFFNDQAFPPIGNVLFGSSATNSLIFGSTSTATNFSGMLNGAGRLVKIGNGVWTLRGTNNSTGDTVVGGGVFVCDGRINSLTLVTNGTLGGTGRVATLTVTNSGGIVNPGIGTNTTGRLRVTGNSSLLAGKLQLELNGTNAVTQHDQIQIDAPMFITNAALQLTFGFSPTNGDRFVIITNTTSGPINGTFIGLTEGSLLNATGKLFRISYVGGDGNDVVLTVVTQQATGVTRVWTGAGSNGFWMNPTNWSGNVRPQGGDSLVFPTGAARRVNTNDYSVDAVFNSLLLGTNGMDLNGNAITLLGGITATNTTGGVAVRMPITFTTNATVTTRQPVGALVLSGPLDAGVFDVTINATGLVQIVSTLTGSGRLFKNGAQDLLIEGTNALTGTNFINQGVLFVDGAIPNARVVIAAGATLQGNGYVGRVESLGGTVLPADVGTTGTLTFGNDVRLSSNSTARFIIEGTSPGTFDQMVMTNTTGIFSISNAMLTLNFNYTPLAGDSFTLISKAGTSNFVGAFNGFPEGGTFTSNGIVYSVTYKGGSGNDFVITAIYAGATGIERVWTGAGSPLTNWSNPTNWSGNVVPRPGDKLFFSGNLSNVLKTNVYDLATNTIFDRITFADGQCRYRIFGTTPLLLENGIVVSNTTFGPSFTVPLELFANQTFSNAGPAGLRVTSVITDGHQLVFDGDGSFTVDGDISGTGALVKRGAGPLRFNAATTFTGLLDVQAGSVEVNSTFSLGGNAAGTTVAEGASLVLVSSGHNWGEPLTLAGTLNAGSNTNITWSGAITLVAPEGNVDVGAGGALRVAAIMGGSGGLTKTGAGTVTLAATNTFTGATLLQAGTLFANAVHTNSAITVNSGVLGGTGIVASVTANGGAIAPGVSPGILRIAGNLALNAGSSLQLDINGLIGGTEYDQLIVSGNVQLGGDAPEISLGFTPALSNTFVIIRNDGANPVSGTFAGVPQGGTFVSDLTTWQVNYAGGDGNDVTLTVVPFVPSGLTSVWTGGGAPNFFWTNASNWAGNILPVAGNDLVFPGTSAGKLNTNNLPTEVYFNSIRFATGQCNYFLLSTGDLKVVSGVIQTNTTSPPAIVAPLRLLADQTFRAYDQLLFLSDILLNGHELIFDTTNTIVIGGIQGVTNSEIITGSGTVRKRGSGILNLQRSNDYTGLTTIEEGSLDLITSTLGSPVDGTVVSNGAFLRIGGLAATYAEPLTLAGTVLFGSVSNFWIGPISLTSSNATIDVPANGTLRVSNLVSGSGSLVKTNNGALILEADNSYSGQTRVLRGSLTLNNSHLTGGVTLNSNTTFTANGQIGSLISTGATFGAGTLTAAGFLQVTGALTFDAATKFDVDIDGTIAGTNYDQVRVGGAVNLGGAQLMLAITVSAPIGSTFVIIRKDSPGAVSGTFAGLPHGTTFTRGAFVWQIDYFAVDGNDVALRVISQTFPGVLWDGGGGDSNWLTASNWLSDATPSPGADLIFSNEADQRTNFNNFAAGTSFNSLRFTGITNANTGFTIGGNLLGLTTGIVADTNANSSTLNFDIAFGSGATIAADSGFNFNGAISNTGSGLVLSGAGSLIFSGQIRGSGGLESSSSFVQLRATNAFSGPTVIHSPGFLRLSAHGALGSPTNLVTIDAGAGLQLSLSNLVVSNAVNLGGIIEGFVSGATNTVSGRITINGTSPTLRSAFGQLNIAGQIVGSSDLIIGTSNFNGGTVVLETDTSHTGTTRLVGGALFVNGFSSDSAFVTISNTTLGGSGQLGSLNAGGIVSPGPSGLPGILRAAGNTTLSNSAALVIGINGTNAGLDYDQLRVSGNVTLGNAALQLSQNFTPAIGATFTIIRNDGASPVSGTFAGLPPGGFVTNCAVFQISYTGGDGNDVVLTTTAQKGPISLWSGGGSDTNWSTAANWFCNLPPNPGDELVFSNLVAKRVMQNDLPAGTSFSRLRFVGFGFGSNFFIGGNALTLTGGIANTSFANSNVLSMPITMAAPMMFSNAGSGGSLVFRGGITNNGNDLRLIGSSFEFVGPYVGAGGIIFSNPVSGFGQLGLRTNNNYSGPTTLLGPTTIFMEQPGGLGDAAAGTFIGESAELILLRPMTLAEPITLAGRLDFANGSNVMAAPLAIAGSNVLMCITSPRMEFNGPINGTGRVVLCGIATNSFNAGGNFSGTLEVFSGRQIIAGQYPGMELLVGGTASFSTSIEGTGRVAAIHAYDQAVNSVVAPGVNGPGILTCSSLVIESNITLRMELNGTAPGSGHDQLLVQGSVALTNCDLELSLGYAPALGDSFTVINNTGSSAIAGAFNGLAEGATFTISNQLFSISYLGGDGNDVVITRGFPKARFNSFTMSNGLFTLQLLGQPGSNYVIEASTNLSNWLPISTNQADGTGLLQFIDADTMVFPMRFYRSLTP